MGMEAVADRDILFGLHETAGIGWQTIARVMNSTIPLAELASCSVKRLVASGIPENKAELVQAGCKTTFINKKKELYAKHNIDVLTITDKRYPWWLKHSAKPPWVLYLKGNTALLGAPLVAMVGTRLPTVYGKRTARALAQNLSQRGITVVSGLARGIDTEAHEGALAGPGGTIAVLGTDANETYPAENCALMRQMIDAGSLAITEYPLGTRSHPGLFPQRNRIIAGLSIGLTVVEADERSGSLITAAQALDENREVFAVPGPISSPKSKGTHKLIQEGAKLVACAEDIISEIAAHLPAQATQTPEGEQRQLDTEPLSAAEQQIVALLGDIPVDLDDLLVRSQMEFGRLHATLLSLLMKRRIVEHAGSAYTILI